MKLSSSSSAFSINHYYYYSYKLFIDKDILLDGNRIDNMWHLDWRSASTQSHMCEIDSNLISTKLDSFLVCFGRDLRANSAWLCLNSLWAAFAHATTKQTCPSCSLPSWARPSRPPCSLWFDRSGCCRSRSKSPTNDRTARRGWWRFCTWKTWLQMCARQIWWRQWDGEREMGRPEIWAWLGCSIFRCRVNQDEDIWLQSKTFSLSCLNWPRRWRLALLLDSYS